jgi:DNA-binding NtrC family response regulator
VLVVDDEAGIRELLARTLALADYEVHAAPNGDTAIDRLREAAFDLLITDLRMPGMDGLALIRQARTLQGTIPTIILTGFSTESIAIEAINLGVVGYVTKPFRVPQILAAAAKALSPSAA